MSAYGHRLAELSAARSQRVGRGAGRPGNVPARRSAFAPPSRGVRSPAAIFAGRTPSIRVEDKRDGAAMQTQSLLFSRSAGWTPDKAKKWAKEHGYKTNKVDVTDQYVRLRQLDPKGFTVKRSIPFGNDIRAVVAREEIMTKKKTTRHTVKSSAKRKPATKHKVAAKRAAPKTRSTRVAASRRPRSAARVATESRRPAARRAAPRTVRATPRARPAARRAAPRTVRATPRTVRATPRARTVRSPRRTVSAARRPRAVSAPRPRTVRSPRPRAMQAWHGDSAGHSKAAKKGWVTRRGGRKTKSNRATEARRPSKRSSRTVRATPRTRTVAAPRPRSRTVASTRRRPSKRSTVREAPRSYAARSPRPSKRSSRTVRATPRSRTVAATRRRPSKRSTVRATPRSYAVRSPKRRIVRAPTLGNIARIAGEVAMELGSGITGFLIADGLDRFLATYDPSATTKPTDKFTSDGSGTLANALNVASPPDLVRYGALVGLTLAPLGGSLFIKHPAVRSSVASVGIGAGIKLASTLWSHVLMPLLVGKDTGVPALQKSWVARLYPAEVAATLNMKTGKNAVSSGGATSTSGTLSGGSDRGVGVGKDAGPFAVGDRFGRGRERGRREWVAPAPWPVPGIPQFADQAPADQPPPPPQPAAWPRHWGERHRWGLRGVGDAVQNMAQSITETTGVHPAHAANAAMHAAAEPHEVTVALRRALPHLNREVLREAARHLHPHLAQFHAHARYPREHDEWVNSRSAEGIAPPDQSAPESEWNDWHDKRDAAGLPPAPPPPAPPAITPPTPKHLRERHEWTPHYGREITYDRYATVQQSMGIGYPGGYAGQPGLGEAFTDAAQVVAATVPDLPLENAVNATAHAAIEPFNLQRAIERALPLIQRELARYCAERVHPHVCRMHERAGIQLPNAPSVPGVPAAPGAPPAPPAVVVDFIPSPPPPGWSRSEAEWHVQERSDWDRAHGGRPAVIAAATQAAQAAAAPHADAQQPAIQAAVNAAASAAAQAASAAPVGTPASDVHAAAAQAAQAATDDHPSVADHPAVQAAAQAAATAATVAAPASDTIPIGLTSATRAAQAAAAPHTDSDHPSIVAAVNAAAAGAAQAAAAVPSGTPAPAVQQAAKDGAKAAVADDHSAVADHPAVKAAIAAAAPAAATATISAGGTLAAGVGTPPRLKRVGPPPLPSPGPQVHRTDPTHSECGCLDDSPYLGFVGDESEPDLLFNLN